MVTNQVECTHRLLSLTPTRGAMAPVSGIIRRLNACVVAPVVQRRQNVIYCLSPEVIQVIS